MKCKREKKKKNKHGWNWGWQLEGNRVFSELSPAVVIIRVIIVMLIFRLLMIIRVVVIAQLSLYLWKNAECFPFEKVFLLGNKWRGREVTTGLGVRATRFVALQMG